MSFGNPIIVDGRRIGYFRETDVGNGFVISFDSLGQLETLLALNPNKHVSIGERKMPYRTFRAEFLSKVACINMTNQYFNGRTTYEINAEHEREIKSKPITEDPPF